MFYLPHLSNLIRTTRGSKTNGIDLFEVAVYEMDPTDAFEEDSLGYFQLQCCQTQPNEAYPLPVRMCAFSEVRR